MKKRNIIFTGLFLLLGMLPLYAQNQSAVRIVNNTGYDIFYIFISPQEDEFWGDDFLGIEEILENGQTLSFTVPRRQGGSGLYDIRLIDEEGDSYIKMGLTLTNNARIVFTQDDLDQS